MDDSVVEYCVSCGKTNTLRVSFYCYEKTYTCEECGMVIKTEILPNPFN